MTVFLFTDIEGYAVTIWEKHIDQIEPVLSRHDSILEENIIYHGGIVFKHSGDRMFAAFEGGHPLQCALEIQKRFAQEDWGVVGRLHICMALHAGEADMHGKEYFGPTVEQTSRLRDLAWGDQILMTSAVLEVCTLPVDATIEDHGMHLLRDLDKPLRILGLLHPDLPAKTFPALKSLSAQPNSLPDALKTARELNVNSLTIYALVGLARTMEMQGEVQQAVELLSLVLKHATSEMVKRKAEALLADLRREMTVEMFTAACRNGVKLDLEEVVNQIIDE
ncbi:MAG: adenylate/guanylate cyclase domain-containing protein [Anaerolineae bacterium]|nr:adenylate/guanylate cyclase domain-containing protein [Anaerolineae bacterium]